MKSRLEYIIVEKKEKVEIHAVSTFLHFSSDFCLQLGIHLALAKIQLTRVLTIAPYYMLSNQTQVCGIITGVMWECFGGSVCVGGVGIGRSGWGHGVCVGRKCVCVEY